jgi:hypothetical protein
MDVQIQVHAILLERLVLIKTWILNFQFFQIQQLISSQFNWQIQKTQLIRITDLKGTEHAQWNIESEDLVQLDVSSLEAGIYVIQVIKDTHLYSKQIVIN